MIKVRRVSDEVMAIVVVFDENELSLICWYALQSGGSLEEKKFFYDQLQGEWD